MQPHLSRRGALTGRQNTWSDRLPQADFRQDVVTRGKAKKDALDSLREGSYINGDVIDSLLSSARNEENNTQTNKHIHFARTHMLGMDFPQGEASKAPIVVIPLLFPNKHWALLVGDFRNDNQARFTLVDSLHDELHEAYARQAARSILSTHDLHQNKADAAVFTALDTVQQKGFENCGLHVLWNAQKLQHTFGAKARSGFEDAQVRSASQSDIDHYAASLNRDSLRNFINTDKPPAPDHPPTEMTAEQAFLGSWFLHETVTADKELIDRHAREETEQIESDFAFAQKIFKEGSRPSTPAIVPSPPPIPPSHPSHATQPEAPPPLPPKPFTIRPGAGSYILKEDGTWQRPSQSIGRSIIKVQGQLQISRNGNDVYQNDGENTWVHDNTDGRLDKMLQKKGISLEFLQKQGTEAAFDVILSGGIAQVFRAMSAPEYHQQPRQHQFPTSTSR